MWKKPDIDRKNRIRQVVVDYRQNCTFTLSASVIIPIHNSRPYLDKLIESLANQSYLPNLFNVILVDDGSNDNPNELIEHYKTKLNIQLVRRSYKKYRIASARNLGIKTSKADVLIFLDSDMIVMPDHISNVMKWYHNGSRVAIIGLRRFIDADLLSVQEIKTNPHILWSFPEVGSCSNRGNSIDCRTEEFAFFSTHPFPSNCFHGCNASCLRKDALDAGLFSEEFDGNWGYEDIEFAQRLDQNDVLIIFDDTITGFHQENTTISRNSRNTQGLWNLSILHNKFPKLGKFRIEETNKIDKDHFK